MTARLECRNLTAARETITVLRDLDLDVDAGQVLTLLGPNGAGKTTLLLTLAGLLPARAGSVSVDGVELRNASATQANRHGVVLVPDNRCLFTSLTVEQNLAVPRRRGGPTPRDMLSTFPALERRWKVSAGALSGGEQQMLAMARALIQEPKVLLIDEMSMGLAPLVVESLFQAVRAIAAEHGTAIVLVEQHVKLSLEVADEAIVLNHGQVVLRDRAESLRHDDRVERAYFDDTGDAVPSGDGATSFAPAGPAAAHEPLDGRSDGHAAPQVGSNPNG
ncbi:ABC transporter ATP-binding protein [Dermatobacter hominis]|uniref:ABC transporter ATP-binding protein n=1 Tax=Dermatobacter hominis TaxID=2884263 RepID=UPI001D10C6A1|nr:ATP-binding cassette domain-containing protein [Dermatobacter hominis]UDY36639.1 ATP-binding cassette domain-containing protein [Dermatobacter hominis]